MSLSTLTDPSIYAIVEGEPGSYSWSQSVSKEGSTLGLSSAQVSSIHFPASDRSVNEEVHAWLVKPSTFDEQKKYPLAMLIHGGPQGSWADSWSTRWNLCTFAEQGYIVVAPNITGSTGYGQKFTDNIRRDWGGAPYRDIVNCFDYVAKLPEVDVDRAVALGASYGGYMMNWIQGHDLGRKFKALVCHDGIFSLTGLLSTEELYFPFYDLGGMPFGRASTDSVQTNLQKCAQNAQDLFGTTSFDSWQENDPSKFLDQWSIPQLVIHNSKDYRLPISEGLAAFNVLQARGIESEFLMYPGENHFVLNPENSLTWHKTVLNFIGTKVGKPKFADEDEHSEEYWGGKKTDDSQGADMPALGKPET